MYKDASSNGVDKGRVNQVFEGDANDRNSGQFETAESSVKSEKSESTLAHGEIEQRTTWTNSIEFLMSCIALSVGFGNVWRFPFVAYENGGGAFLIPYIIVLFLVGKPFYYLEMVIGQFSSKSCVQIWRLSPACVGVGWAQLCSLIALASYYCALMSLTLYYLIMSFSAELPWAWCREEWGDFCVASGVQRSAITTKVVSDNATSSTSNDVLEKLRLLNITSFSSSAELYFTKIVLKEKDSIDDGIGLPNWELTLCLAASWTCVCLVLSRGIKSTGKASYFLALFPYVVLMSLLIRAVTLDGAGNGILFFISPNWGKLLDPTVWYAAVSQCFFSLSVCFGSIIMYASHNQFRHNVYRDAMIVTSLDTVTSLIAGCTIFGILGNLAHETGSDDISSVVRPGTGLAFVSYPDAIAKFTVLPQLFAVLFFLMMFVLGVGSAVGITSSITNIIGDQFPKLKVWQIALPTCFIGFCVGTIYVTPGGQYILTLVDYYGTSFVVFVLAVFEITGIIWIYGLENILNDMEFMLGRRESMYWRLCWAIVTPSLLLTVFIYTMFKLTPVTYGGVEMPTTAHAAGWILFAFGVLQIPTWMAITIFKNRGLPFPLMIKNAFRPAKNWGPLLSHHREEWLVFKDEKKNLKKSKKQSRIVQLIFVILNINEK
ncbi:sodium-dependent nutrient amino acid transporter 1 [Cephus cinctus]|uniref:Transporter n=1 Tax=Cephus cinctus TaxID=211228 RepID=A0AAJ7BP74_CEPCN|nr:sodium-dependent nutrient amino acid transporter 1 [Cephus cinctus]